MRLFIGFIVFFLIFNLLLIAVKMYKLEILQGIKNKKIRLLAAFLPFFIVTLLSFCGLFFDMINTTILWLYFAIIWNIVDLIAWIIKKIFHKGISKNLICIISLLITLLYLGHAYYLAHHVVATHYTILTDKDIGSENFRIVQISDSHIGSTMDGDDFIRYMEKINEEKPDIVVITGDFVDDDTKKIDMIKACEGLGKLKTKYGVYFTYGNHDRGYFTYRNFDDKNMREELTKNNVILLEDDVVAITDKIYLIGRQDKITLDRKSISELVENIDKEKYIIDLNHQPNDYDNEEKAGVDLVLSGHTHGGQFFPLGPLGVWVKINDAYYGLETRGKTNFIVNSGIGDWTIKFKTGTVAEYGVIDIKMK